MLTASSYKQKKILSNRICFEKNSTMVCDSGAVRSSPSFNVPKINCGSNDGGGLSAARKESEGKSIKESSSIP